MHQPQIDQKIPTFLIHCKGCQLFLWVTMILLALLGLHQPKIDPKNTYIFYPKNPLLYCRGYPRFLCATFQTLTPFSPESTIN